MEVIKTNIPCAKCGDLLCNLCAFNGECEKCGKKLTSKQKNKIAKIVVKQLTSKSEE